MELYTEDIITTQTINDILSGVSVSKGTTSDILSETASNVLKNKILYGGTIMKASYKSAITGARVEIFPDYDKTIGFASYDENDNNVFKTVVSGADIGDVVIGDFAGGQGAKWDKSAGTFTVLGNVEAAEIAAGVEITSPIITGGTITGSTIEASSPGTYGIRLNSSINQLELLYNDVVQGVVSGWPYAQGVAISMITDGDGTGMVAREGTSSLIMFYLEGNIVGYIDGSGFHNGTP